MLEYLQMREKFACFVDYVIMMIVLFQVEKMEGSCFK
jgi:hypothetical protein